MFPTSINDEAASPSVYARGYDLARLGHVEAYTPDYFDDSYGLVQLDGAVRGSQGTRYSTWVTLDVVEESVDSYGCTCPAAEKYYGMCKHAVALALRFLDDVGMLNVGFSPRVAAQSGVKPRREPYERPTSTSISKLISQRADELSRRARAQAAADAALNRDSSNPKTPTGPVDFVVTLARWSSYYSYSDDNMWELRLKICSGKASYVVKRIGDLVDAWEDGDFIEYGKNLAFAHVKSAFSHRANALLEVLARVVRAQRALYLSRDRYSLAGRGTGTKELPLSAADTIDVLDALMGTQVFFESEGRVMRKKPQRLNVVREDVLQLPIRLEESKDSGYDLVLPEDVDFVVAGEVAYQLGGAVAARVESPEVSKIAPLLDALLPANYVAAHISAKDMPAFCVSVLPLLDSVKGFVRPGGLDELMPPMPEFAFRLGLADGYVVCAASVAYGQTVLGLFEDAAPDQPARDIEREMQAQQLVRAFFVNGDNSTPNYVAVPHPSYRTVYGAGVPGRTRRAGEPDLPWFYEEDSESMYLLMTDGLRQFAAIGEVFLSERLRSIEVRQAPEIKVQVNARAGLLDLQVEADDLSPEDLLAYLASYRRKQRYVRLTSGDIMLLGEGVGAVGGLAEGLGLDERALVEGGAQLSANRTLFIDALMKDAPGVRFDRDRAFRQIVRSFDTIADSDYIEPDGLRQVLRPYQRTGFKWLSTLADLGFGGILADDMGLGKTLQLIAVFAARKRDRAEGGEEPQEAAGRQESGGAALPMPTTSLVVCPASLVYNWLSELERFAPELDCAGVLGPKQARMRAIASAGEYDVLITSYDLMKRDIDTYAACDFDIVALDEAQYIKNASTKSAKAAKRLPAHVRFALTGTPIENRLAELWSIFDFLMPGILGGHESFARRFEKPVESGEPGAAKRLQALVSPFILRRLKADVLSDLPEKNESVVFAALEGEQKKLYDANVAKLALSLSKQMPDEFAQNKLAILAELTRLRQLCCDPHLVYENYEHGSAKLETCAQLVTSAVEGGHKVLLFSQFTSMLDLIAARFETDGVGFRMLTGSTSKEQRVRLVREFQEGSVPVFLISLKAGGVGLNLTAADIVIHYDPWWNLAAQNQATDRAHRIGQTRDVSVFKLIAKGTIEEKIVQMQESKRDLAESVIGGEGVSSAALTREDVLALLGAEQTMGT